MKTIMPKPFERLSNGDKQAIYRAVSRLANEQIDKEEAEMQKIWLQMACIVLHNGFGFGKSRLPDSCNSSEIGSVCIGLMPNWETTRNNKNIYAMKWRKYSVQMDTQKNL